MALLDYLLEFPWIRPLAWTLAHFLWQGAVIGIATRILWQAAHAADPRVNYAIGLGSLLACAIAPLVTFVVLAEPFSAPAPKVVVLGNARENPRPDDRETPALQPLPAKESLPHPLVNAPVNAPDLTARGIAKATVHGSFFRDLVRWIVPIWFAGVCFLTVRLVVSWVRAQGWRRQARPATEEWLEAAVRKLAGALQVSPKIRVLLSSLVPGPLTLGAFQPVILLPAQLLTGLSREHLQAILAHELAHIRRHDYLVNLLQSALEVLLFYHPAVWWLSAQVRQTREECCDAMAASICADKKTYVCALASLAEFQISVQPALGAHDGDLLSRVLQLLGRRQTPSLLSGKSAAWFLCLLVAALTAWGMIFSFGLIAAEQPSVANTKKAPRGIVVDEKDSPVAGAEVVLYYAKNTWGLGNAIRERIRTDESGRFACKEPLEFEVPNGTDNTDHYILFALAQSQAPAWQVLVGGTPDEKEYRLTVTMPVRQSYEVADKKGAPIAGVRVWLRYAGTQRDKPPFFFQSFIVPEDLGLCSALTDEDGRATLSTLPNTNYSVAASKGGFEDNLSCTTPREGMPKFTMVPAATLEGRVTDPLGLPVEGAMVWLYPKFKWHMYFLAKTDKDGRYRVEKIWSNGDRPDWGHYDAGIRHPNFTTKEREVSFTSGQHVTGFNFSAEPGVSLQGRIFDPGTGQPVAGAAVIVDSLSGRQNLKSDTAGDFQCRVLSGKVSIIGSEAPGGYYFAENNLSDLPSNVQTVAFGSRFGVKVYLGGPLGKLGRLLGKVVSAEGKPAPFCSVKTVPMAEFLRTTPFYSGAWRGCYTDKDGHFVSPCVPIGLPFGVMAEMGKTAGLAKGEMTRDGQTLPAAIHLEPTDTAQILLLDRENKPRPNVDVTVVPVLGGTLVYSKEKKLQTDKSGLLKVSGAIPGIKYRLELAKSETSDVTAELIPKDGAPPVSRLVLSDKYLARLEGPEGRAIPIAKFREYWVWILDGGQRVRWTNDGRIPILARQGDDIIVSRKPFLLGRPGDKVDALVETKGGRLIRAVGYLPELPSQPLVFKAAESATKPDAQPDPSLTGTGAQEIAGRVVDPDGKPVAGAKVTLAGSQWLGSQAHFETDEQGTFRIPNMTEKWYSYMSIQKDGYGPVFLTDVPFGEGFRVSLQNSTRLKGKIGDEKSGKASILLEKNKPTRRERMGFEVRGLQFRTETAGDGRYDFPIEPGSYHYKLQSQDGRFSRGEIVVGEGQITSFPAALQTGHAVTFEIVDWQTEKPVPGITASIYERTDVGMIGERANSRRTSDAQGLMKWENLMPGETEFWAVDMFHATGITPQVPYSRWWREDEPKEWLVIRAKATPPTREKGTSPISVEAGPEMKPVRILVEKGVKISGVVRDKNKAPLAGIQIGVVPNEGRRATLTGDTKFLMTTDQDGKFSGYIPAGNGVVYNLCAYAPARADGQEAGPANAVSEPFSSKPGDIFTFELAMTQGGWLSGRVIDPKGNPIAGLEVQTTNADFRDSAYADRLTKTDADGKFRIGPLRAGNYMVQPDTMENINIAMTPGFTPPNVTIADGEEKNVGEIIFPGPSR